jgi:cytochrome c-type biogenesis protein CcmE
VKRKRAAVGVVIGAVLAAIAVLTVTSISSASTFYYTADQFGALPPAVRHGYVQVNGTLGPDIRWDPATVTLSFDLDGAKPGTRPVPVVYRGPEPSPFAPGMSVVVAGRLGPDGVFRAGKLMIKCPSRYTARPGT